MKKFVIAILVAIVSMMTVAAACADSSAVPELEFKKKSFEGGQMLPVYNGPGYEYERPTGWAKVSTDDTIWMAGRVNEWALIMYTKNGGGFRTGWIDCSKLTYKLGGKDITLSRVSGTMKVASTLTDDPKNQSAEIAKISANARVTVLAKYYDHQSWLYVEVVQDGQPKMGFVPAENVNY